MCDFATVLFASIFQGTAKIESRQSMALVFQAKSKREETSSRILFPFYKYTDILRQNLEVDNQMLV